MRQIILICFLIIFSRLQAQKLYSEMTIMEKNLYDEHIIDGQPDGINKPVFVRHGYVLKYNEKYRIPDWVAYHVTQEYLKTPKREKKFLQFTKDPDIAPPVENLNYTGTGYSRGHMAPYFAMGGDRNKDGVYSSLFDNASDPYDDLTVLQCNYMSNITPQDQDALNGAGGPWYALETAIRDKLVRKDGLELHIVVGSIINDPENYKILEGSYGNFGIAVPDQFFQVLIYKDAQGNYYTAGFLFTHVKRRTDLPYANLIEYLVPVDSIEILTGLDFMNKLDKTKQKKTESIDNKDFWTTIGLK